MRIALRTSGGRGEYEVSGSHGDISVSDVIDHSISFQIFPGKIIKSNNVIRRLQGKPRIRLVNPSADQHLYLSLAEVLMMPKPIRELGKTPGGKIQLTSNNFSVRSIQFDVISLMENELIIQPTDLIIENSDYNIARIDILERLRIILDIWGYAEKSGGALSEKVKQHRDAVLQGNLGRLGVAARSLREEFLVEDPLRELLREYELVNQYTFWAGIHTDDAELALIDDDFTPPEEAIGKRIKQWRMQASRGSKGVRFSNLVKSEYNNRCLFTGYYLPKSEYCPTPGVDAAHILPWAEYDIDAVSNGLCLSKLCHWAFDNGLLLLNYVKSKSAYELSLSRKAVEAEKNKKLSLEAFREIQGYIPTERLPMNKKSWPSPVYLEEYNSAATILD